MQKNASPTAQIKEKLYDVIKQARASIECVNDMRAKVLLKTTADLISNLASVYEDYELKRKAPWAPAEKTPASQDRHMYFSQFKNDFDKKPKKKAHAASTSVSLAA
jgi:hypothetical protein